MLISTVTVFLVAYGGRSAWYLGVVLLVVYATFAMTLYLLPPAAGSELGCHRGRPSLW